jgi:crotonobetainyl-CoA:carnitine CoA-transferase CaiB-like acyl-CoA transferase
MPVLNDLRVLELGEHPGMRYAGKIFAHLGARVAYLGRGASGSLPDGRARVRRAHDAWLDAGKTASPVDLSRHEDRDALQALVADTDVVLDSRSAREIEAHGFPVAAIAQINGTAQIVSVGDFGAAGPYKDYVASDGVIRALGGMIYPVGSVERPMMLSEHQSLVFLGLTAFNAAMSGVLSGQGHQWDVNALEAVTVFSDWHIVQRDAAMLARIGLNRFTSSCPSGTFECADGWIGGTANTFPQWTDFCEMFGLPLAGDPDLATSVLRARRWGELYDACRSRLKNRTVADVHQEVLERKLPLAVVPKLEDIVDGKVEHLEGVMETVRHGDMSFRAPAIPFGRHDTAFEGAPDGGGTGKDTVSTTIGSTTGMPLSRLRVLDLSMGWAGPLVTRQLGDLGALVVKVESCGYFDWWRGNDIRDAFYDEQLYEKNAAFIALNRNKTGIAVDLTKPEGVAIVKRLVETCDIVVENYARDVLPKLGLDYGILSQRNPRLIMLSMAAYPNGIYDQARAYGSTLECASGMPIVSGREGDPPTMNNFAYGDACGGLNGLAALLAAVHHRDRTGRGRHVQLSQVQAMLPLIAPWIIERSVTGRTPPRLGNRHPDFVPNGIFRGCEADTFIYLTIKDDAQWQSLAGLVGDNRLAAADLQTADGRRAREDEIEAIIEEWTRRKPVDDSMEDLQAHGIAAGVVRRPEKMVSDPQLEYRGFWQKATRPFTGETLTTSLPFRNGASPFPVRLAAPTLGQFNDEVLGDLLGLTQQEIAGLKERLVIGSEAIRSSRKKRAA